MKDQHRYLLKTVVQNSSLLFILCSSGYLLYLYKFTTSAPMVESFLAVILSVLSLSAISAAIDRYFRLQRIEDMLSASNEMLLSRVSPPAAEALFSSEVPGGEFLANCARIDLFGVNLTSFLGSSKDSIKAAVLSGARLRIIVIDSESQEAMEGTRGAKLYVE